MKTEFKVSKEFILMAYNDACYRLKSKLRAEFPEAFELERKVGDWVTTIGTTFHSEKNNGNTFKIGYVDTQSLFVCEEKKDEGYGVFNGEFRLATPEEILVHLGKEADKRGIKAGVTIDNSMLSGTIGRVKLTWGTFRYVYSDSGDYLRLGGDKVYKNGDWATIIPTEVEVSMEEIAKWKGCEINELKIK